MSPLKKKKLSKIRNDLDKLDDSLIKIINMAIGEDALEGLDLSVLQNITVNPDEDAKKDKEKDESPSIFEPQLKIQEVDEIPEEKKEEVKVEEVEPSEEVKEEIKDEPASETKTEDKEEYISEAVHSDDVEKCHDKVCEIG